MDSSEHKQVFMCIKEKRDVFDGHLHSWVELLPLVKGPVIYKGKRIGFDIEKIYRLVYSR